jgi:hypothetical protein
MDLTMTEALSFHIVAVYCTVTVPSRSRAQPPRQKYPMWLWLGEERHSRSETPVSHFSRLITTTVLGRSYFRGSGVLFLETGRALLGGVS